MILEILKISQKNDCVGVSFGVSLCWSFLESKYLRTPILKKIYKRLLLFVSPQFTIANSNPEFGLDQTSHSVNQVFILNLTNLFVQMQPCHLYRPFVNLDIGTSALELELELELILQTPLFPVP